MKYLLLLLCLYPAALLGGPPEKFGDPMPAEPCPVTLREAVSLLSSDALPAEIKIEGVITEVCQKKGCWMVLVDGDVHARVRFKDYGFFVPADSQGRQSVVFGTLAQKNLSAGEASHYAEDADRPDPDAGPTREYTITASSVVIGAEPAAVSGIES